MNSKSKKNNKKANGFLMFMLEYQRKHKLDLGDAQETAGSIWKGMSAEKRKPYNLMTNDPVEATRPSRIIQAIEREGAAKKEEAKVIRAMEVAIEEMLQTAEAKNELQTTTFIFFSTSYFVQTLKDDIFPAEIAMAKFSLKEGVFDTLHMLVNPGDLPLGSAGPAMIYSKKTHRLPLPPAIEGETNYEIILQKILDFIGDDKPLIFVESGHVEDQIKAAMKTLEKITLEAGEDSVFFRVYPMEELFLRLHNKLSNDISFPSITYTLDKISRQNFTENDIGCDFHQKEDANSQCCLAKVKSWGYTIARCCLDKTVMIPGRHKPASTRLDQELLSNSSSNDFSGDGWDDEVSIDFQNLSIGSVDTLIETPENFGDWSRQHSIASLSSSIRANSTYSEACRSKDFVKTTNSAELDPNTQMKKSVRPKGK